MDGKSKDIRFLKRGAISSLGTGQLSPTIGQSILSLVWLFTSYKNLLEVINGIDSFWPNLRIGAFFLVVYTEL